MDGRSYLPWLWLSSAWTVSPAPLQAARLESLLVNKPKAPAASTRDPTGFIIRSLRHFCCPPLQHKHSWTSEQRTLCLAAMKLRSSEQKTSQEPPALSSWALQRKRERRPQSQTVLPCKAHTTYTPNWVIYKSLSTANNALSPKPWQEKPSLCYEFSNHITDAMCKFLSKTKIPCTVKALILSSNFSKTLYLNQKM